MTQQTVPTAMMRLCTDDFVEKTFSSEYVKLVTGSIFLEASARSTSAVGQAVFHCMVRKNKCCNKLSEYQRISSNRLQVFFPPVQLLRRAQPEGKTKLGKRKAGKLAPLSYPSLWRILTFNRKAQTGLKNSVCSSVVLRHILRAFAVGRKGCNFDAGHRTIHRA
jgi:hypothetical protein